MKNIGASRYVKKSGAKTAAATRRLNLPALRGFFMGVIGWPPQTVLHGAALRDLAEAYIAHRRSENAVPDLPDTGFMRRMLAQYPDTAPGTTKDKTP